MKTSIRFLSCLCALMLLCAGASAELAWPAMSTPGQQLLQAYVETVNMNQSQQGAGLINSIFECYSSFAVMGVTAQDGSSMPEGLELTFTLNQDSLDTLQLRVSDPSRFAAMAASCIQAASPDAVTLAEALEAPAARAKQAAENPGNSFEDEVIDLNGLAPRVYYAYYPNQYRDGVNWLQMTLIFPLPGADDADVITAETPAPAGSEEYEGYEYDGGTHLEIFVTATPEPDSPAGEQN